MYLTDATYTTRDRLLSTSLWNTIRSNLCNFLHKFTGCPPDPPRSCLCVPAPTGTILGGWATPL